MKVFEKLFLGFVSTVSVFMLYVLFVVIPVNVYKTKYCLDSGYDKIHTTFTLESYCSKTNDTTVVTPIK